MTAQERGPFEKLAKDAKVGPQNEVEKFTSQGVSLKTIDKEQKLADDENRTMRRTIQNLVLNCFTNNSKTRPPRRLYSQTILIYFSFVCVVPSYRFTGILLHLRDIFCQRQRELPASRSGHGEVHV